jgi:hypothetical protein
MNVLTIILRSSRPSRLNDMKAVAMPRWIRRGYDGLTFFGHIITHSQQEAEAFNTCFGSLKNHEMIHLYQARACHDSWWLFYLRYGWYWLTACRYFRKLKNAGYLLNPFELEAYTHMHDLHYLDNKQSGTNEWRRYAEMSLLDRLEIYLKQSNSY